MAEEELKLVKEAITDLYLAIKIRSTEEVILFFTIFQLDSMDEDKLSKE